MDEIRAPGARDDKCKQAGGDSGTLCNFVVRSWTDPPAPPAGAAVIGSFISIWIKPIITKASYLPITLCISFFFSVWTQRHTIKTRAAIYDQLALGVLIHRQRC